MNKLDSRIRILKTDADDELIPLRSLDTKTCVCTLLTRSR